MRLTPCIFTSSPDAIIMEISTTGDIPIHLLPHLGHSEDLNLWPARALQ